MEKDSFSDGQNSEFKSVNYEFSYHSSIDPKRTDNSRIYKNKRDVSSESGQDRTFGPWTSYYEQDEYLQDDELPMLNVHLITGYNFSVSFIDQSSIEAFIDNIGVLDQLEINESWNGAAYKLFKAVNISLDQSSQADLYDVTKMAKQISQQLKSKQMQNGFVKGGKKIKNPIRNKKHKKRTHEQNLSKLSIIEEEISGLDESILEEKLLFERRFGRSFILYQQSELRQRWSNLSQGQGLPALKKPPPIPKTKISFHRYISQIHSPHNTQFSSQKAKLQHFYIQLLLSSHKEELFYLACVFRHIKSQQRQQQILQRFTVLPQTHYSQFKTKIPSNQILNNYFILDLSCVVTDISEFTSLKWNHLVILDLEDSSIRDDGWNLLAKNAHKYQHLRKIFLNKNKIANITKTDFNHFLELHALELLNLQQNYLLTEESKQVLRKMQNYTEYSGKFSLKKIEQVRYENEAAGFIDSFQILQLKQKDYIEKYIPQELKSLLDKINQLVNVFGEAKTHLIGLFQSYKTKFYEFILMKGLMFFKFVKDIQEKYKSRQAWDQQFNLFAFTDMIGKVLQIVFECTLNLSHLKETINLFYATWQQIQKSNSAIAYQKIIKLIKYALYKFLIALYKHQHTKVDKGLIQKLKFTKKMLEFIFDVFLLNMRNICKKLFIKQNDSQDWIKESQLALKRILSYQDQDQNSNELRYNKFCSESWNKARQQCITKIEDIKEQKSRQVIQKVGKKEKEKNRAMQRRR